MAATADIQARDVFTHISAADVAKLLVSAPSIAADNNCTFLDKDTKLQWEPTDENRLAVNVRHKATGEQIGAPSRFGSRKVMFIGAVRNMYVGQHSVIKEDTGMQASCKQTVYIEALQGNDDSVAAIKELTSVYSAERWSAAVAKSGGKHAIMAGIKKNKQDEKGVREHCLQMAQRGAVFFPVAPKTDDDDEPPAVKFSSKLHQSKCTHMPAAGTGFDIDVVNDYFKANPGNGIALIDFIGRDGTSWKGKPEDLREINAAFFVVTLHPDWFAAKINKVTMPHRVQTIVCLDATTSCGAKKPFSMPNVQAFVTPADPASTPAPAGDPSSDDDDETDVNADADEFVRARKRARTSAQAV